MKNVLLLQDMTQQYYDMLCERWKAELGMKLIVIATTQTQTQNVTRVKTMGKKVDYVTFGTAKDFSCIGPEVADLISESVLVDGNFDWREADEKVGVELVTSTPITSIHLGVNSDEEQNIKSKASSSVVDVDEKVLASKFEQGISPSVDLDIDFKDLGQNIEETKNDSIVFTDVTVQKILSVEQSDDKSLIKLQEEIVTLKKSIDMYKDSIQDLMQKLKTSIPEEQLEAVRLELLAKEAELEASKTAYGVLQGDYDALLESRRIDLETIKVLRDDNNYLRSMAEKYKDSESGLDMMDDTKVNLEAEVLELREKLVAIELTRDTLTLELETLKDEMVEKNTVTVEGQKTTIVDLEKELSTSKEDAEQLRSIIQVMQENLTNLRGTHEDSIAMQTEFDETKLELDNVKLELDACKEELKEATLKLNDIDSLKEQYEEEISTYKESVSKLTEDLDMANEDLSVEKKLNDTIVEENSLLKYEIERLNQVNMLQRTDKVGGFNVGASINMLAKQPLVSRLTKLGVMSDSFLNVYLFAGLTSDTDVCQILLNLVKTHIDKRFLFIDLAVSPRLDWYFDYRGSKKRGNGVEAWLDGSRPLKECILSFGNHYYMYGAYAGMNDAALLSVDWNARFKELDSLGYTVVINWGYTGSAVRDNLLNTWVGHVHIHLCTQASVLALRDSMIQLQRFDFDENIKLTVVDVVPNTGTEILDMIRSKHKGYIQTLLFGSSDAVEL